MWATASAPRSRALFIAWVAFSAVNILAMFAWPTFETIPFYLVWVSLTLVYGYRPWRPIATATVVTAVVLVTMVAILLTFVHDAHDLAEVAEIPLMGAMFLSMAWNAHRRQVAIDQAHSLAALQRASMAREREFVQLASHALRTPLTVARGHVELLLQSDLEGQKRQDVEVVLDELSHLTQLSERLLNLVAAEHPDFLQRTPIGFEWLLDEVRRRWPATAPRRWVFDAEARCGVYADPRRLMVALDALIENAVEFTHDGDVVSVVATADGTNGVIAVSDTGIGITPENLARIFDPSARVDGGPERSRAGGTGLGLRTVKAMAEAHGGSVSVRSEPGRGTTFELRLPRMAMQSPPPG